MLFFILQNKDVKCTKKLCNYILMLCGEVLEESFNVLFISTIGICLAKKNYFIRDYYFY
jgi:hypothetical protein